MPHQETIKSLTETGIELNDAISLTRISKSLHHWFELEAGGGDTTTEWKVERDNEDRPHLMITHRRDGFKSAIRIPDRRKGAIQRLTKIMEKYPKFKAFVQTTDPSKPTLYVLRPGDAEEVEKKGRKRIDYTKGIPIFE